MKYKKCKRFNIPGHLHELTFSCFKNQPLLDDEETCKFLTKAISTAMAKHRFELWAYIFMPNHAHLLIAPKEKNYSISKILQSIKQSSSRNIINYYRRMLPDKLELLRTCRPDRPFKFWQEGGGYDRNVFSIEATRNSVQYIHNNPLRWGLVEDPVAWPWSSYRNWTRNGTGPISIDANIIPAI